MKRYSLTLFVAIISMAANAQQWEIDYGNATSYTIMKSGIVNSNGENVLVGVSGTDKNHYYPAIMSAPSQQHLTQVTTSLTGLKTAMWSPPTPVIPSPSLATVP